MKKTILSLICVSLLAFSPAGCSKEEPATEPNTTEPAEQMELASYTCPDCGENMEANAFCAQCVTVASTGDTVHCDKCDKDYTEGLYCAECNRFMFDDPYFCATENREFPKGTFCPKEGAYRGLTAVKYCPECKEPFDGALEKCPNCGK